MKKRTSVFIFGAALLVGAAPALLAAARTGAAQPSSSTKSSAASAAKKKKTFSKYKKKSRVHAQAAPTPDRIKEIQTALQKDGSYDGDPTGKWDAATIDAMKKFQDKNGFTPTGKIDALSLNKLGLGSETAGKGAPIPVAAAASPATATPAVAIPRTASTLPPSSADPSADK